MTDIEELTQLGIYKITCNANNKVYIGSACYKHPTCAKCTGFYGRWSQHIYRLQQGKHRNKHLQSAFNKYGLKSFSFVMLETLSDVSKILEREELCIKLFDATNQEKGFNVLKNAFGNYKPPTQSTREKLSKAFLGKKRPLEIVKKWSKRVQQIDKNNKVVAEYYSMSEAERNTGIMRQDIGQACIGRKIKRAGGFYWKIINEVKDIV